MKNIIRRAIFGILIISFLCGCSKRPERPFKPEGGPEVSGEFDFAQASSGTKQELKVSELGEEQKILSFDMTGYTKDGRKKWEIQGKSADIISDIVVLDNIEANAYSDDRIVTLKARNGSFDKKENSVRLESDVVVTTSDGISLQTEWLKWESKTDNITTDTFVEVKRDNLYAAGYGASASTRNKEVQLSKNVVVIQGDVTISCEGPFTIDYGNDLALFCHSVKVAEPRGELFADRLHIFFNLDTREIETVIAEGNVELKQGPNVAKGQKIVYTLASGEAVLTGNPEILIYSKKDLENAFTGN